MTNGRVRFVSLNGEFIEVEKFFLSAFKDRDFNGVVAIDKDRVKYLL